MGVAALQMVISAVLAGAPETFVLLKPAPTFLPAAGISTDAGTAHVGCCSTSTKTIAARFIAEDDEFIEIETLGRAIDSGRHCGANFDDDESLDHQLQGYQIRVRVRRSDVALVLRQPLRTPSYEVAAGLPVEVVDGGLFFGLYGTTREFVLPEPDSVTGITYTPKQWKPAPEKTHPKDLRLLSGVVAPVGDGGVIWLLPGEIWSRSAAQFRGEEALLSVSAECARLNARVPVSSFETMDAGARQSSGTISLCGSLSSELVRKGATVFWPDGRTAGVLLQEDGLWGARWTTDAGLRCTDTTLQGVEGSLPLCFRPADIRSRRSKP